MHCRVLCLFYLTISETKKAFFEWVSYEERMLVKAGVLTVDLSCL